MNARAALDQWLNTESVVELYNRFNGNSQLTINDF